LYLFDRDLQLPFAWPSSPTDSIASCTSDVSLFALGGAVTTFLRMRVTEGFVDEDVEEVADKSGCVEVGEIGSTSALAWWLGN
jgi:hypothetical protein